ncbi:MAG: hypothetical protein KF691_11345 [Phycisphaeraceae bacterium]|nr:hypothetical protein [Phycisphaeraceae bacterium]
MRSTCRHARVPISRRGTAYVVAVGIGLMVAAVSLGGMAVARSRSESNKLRRDEVQARIAAKSAIELARALIQSDSSWRTTRTNGTWNSGQSLQDSTFDVSVSNPSGPLNNSELDSVVVLGDASVGRARQRLSVQLDAKTVPLDCLAVPLTVGGAITATSSTINPSGATIATNVSITSVLATIRPNVEATVSIIGTGFYGTTKSGVAARTLPKSSVFDSYVAAGTPIPIGSLPVVSLKPTLQKVVLSPASNPYGATNANGIYVIDCQGQSLIITNCRIAGTLVLLNPGLSTAVTGGVRWAPAVSNYPCLLVNGSIALQMTSANLSESSLNANFNPPGTPYVYPTGSTDTDTSDSYPSSITGLIYASGNVTTSNAPTVSVLVVKGTLSVGGTLTLSYSSTPYTSPPPGFYTVSMTPSQGSWKQIVDDPPVANLIQTK